MAVTTRELTQHFPRHNQVSTRTVNSSRPPSPASSKPGFASSISKSENYLTEPVELVPLTNGETEVQEDELAHPRPYG